MVRANASSASATARALGSPIASASVAASLARALASSKSVSSAELRPRESHSAILARDGTAGTSAAASSSRSRA